MVRKALNLRHAPQTPQQGEHCGSKLRGVMDACGQWLKFDKERRLRYSEETNPLPSSMPITSFTASGYTKHRDAKAEPQQMTIETQKHVDPSKGANMPVGLIVRMGIQPKPGDRALDDLVENPITLTLSQAVLFASALLAEVAQIQQVLDKRI